MYFQFGHKFILFVNNCHLSWMWKWNSDMLKILSSRIERTWFWPFLHILWGILLCFHPSFKQHVDHFHYEGHQFSAPRLQVLSWNFILCPQLICSCPFWPCKYISDFWASKYQKWTPLGVDRWGYSFTACERIHFPISFLYITQNNWNLTLKWNLVHTFSV